MDYFSLISVENIFQAWEEFKKGKRKKHDVQVFERNLEDNLFGLQYELAKKTYRHGNYHQFYVNDPKRRHIHKAEVCDRIVHHLLYKYLYKLFDKTFVYDSYSCRLDKGTHRAVKRLEYFSRKLSKNYTRDFWSLKLDIKQFFASVDHEILSKFIAKKVKDIDVLWLIGEVINSYSSSEVEKQTKEVLDKTRTVDAKKGIPLGNLTSQIFANIYLNQLDRFIKHNLKIKYYLRYADDFMILDNGASRLLHYNDILKSLLAENLKLELHPAKISFRKFSWGIDFCGYIVLPHYIKPRTKTKRRIFKKTLNSKISNQAFQSYLGYFSHANSYNLTQGFKNQLWFTAEGE